MEEVRKVGEQLLSLEDVVNVLTLRFVELITLGCLELAYPEDGRLNRQRRSFGMES